MPSLANTMQSLYRHFGELPGIHIELHRELIAIRVENAKASATVFLQGAQLSHYQRHNEPPIIWCSPLCDYQSGTPLRGGIPVCWPWFGALEKNPDAVRKQIQGISSGTHGLVRDREWQLDKIEIASGDLTTLVFSLALAKGRESAWPTATGLTLRFDIGEVLTLTFSVSNDSAETVRFSSALHSYFAVSDIDKVSIDGLEGLSYIDTLKDWSLEQQSGTVVIDREVDRIYHGTSKPITIIDRGWQRAIEIASQGSNSAIVWNPWIEKSRRLSHFADDAYQQMLCIETANADRDFVELEASRRHHLNISIGCRLLS